MSQKIVINLNETDTKSYEDSNFIQVTAKIQFDILLDKFLPKEKNYDSKPIKDQSSCNFTDSKSEFTRVHNTILINGKRGMGKTSFALSLINYLPAYLCPLRIIDPTLIETKEHVFILIITLIKEKVENYIKCNNCDTTDSTCRSWKESLKKLAGGLSMLAEVGGDHLKDSLWDSPELILEKGLSNTKHGYKLEENFHEFVAESLKILGKDKKAFFIILDDIDTSAERGTVILEVLRKYITTPQIITMLLGDIELYSTLVRQMQWEKIDSKKILKDYELNNPDKKNIYLSQIEHLEEQYLVKILKPENRIDLQSMLALYENITIKTQNNDELTCSLFVDSIFKAMHIKSQKDRNYFVHILLKQSTRSIIQIFESWGKQKELVDTTTRIKHTFYSTLFPVLHKSGLLDSFEFSSFYNYLSIFVMEKKFTKDNHLKLIPDFKDEHMNVAMLYLNSLASQIKPEHYLSYLIKVGYATEHFNLLGTNDIEKYVNHIALDSSESSTKIARRILSTWGDANNENISRKPVGLGTIFINKDNFSKISKIDNLSLALSRVIGNNGPYNFFSIFNLFGFLADISENHDNTEQVSDLFENHSQILEFVHLGSKIINDHEFEINNEDETYKYSDDMQISLSKWATQINNNDSKTLPLTVLSKIWIRALYSLANISDNQRHFTNYYEVVEMQLVAILHAYLVEISIYEKFEFGISASEFMKNIAKSSMPYFQKAKSYYQKYPQGNNTLFDNLYSCELFRYENGEYIYFKELKSILLKPDFMSLTDAERIKAVQSIPSFSTKTHGTVNTELSKIYSNINQQTLGNTLKGLGNNRQSTIQAKPPKINFLKLSPDEQKKLITAIPDWQNKPMDAIRKELSNTHNNIKEIVLTKLIQEMKDSES